MASPRIAFGRVLVLAVSSAGIVAAIAVLALSWPAPTGLFMARLLDSASLIMCLLILGIGLLIAWRAGDHAPNIAIALALTFIYGSIAVALLFDRLQVMPLIRQIVQMSLFFLGGALYIRSSQLFPRKLTATDIISSPTIWGKSPPLQKTAVLLLLASAILGAIFGLAFHPLKHRIEHFLKRFAPGRNLADQPVVGATS